MRQWWRESVITDIFDFTRRLPNIDSPRTTLWSPRVTVNCSIRKIVAAVCDGQIMTVLLCERMYVCESMRLCLCACLCIWVVFFFRRSRVACCNADRKFWKRPDVLYIFNSLYIVDENDFKRCLQHYRVIVFVLLFVSVVSISFRNLNNHQAKLLPSAIKQHQNSSDRWRNFQRSRKSFFGDFYWQFVQLTLSTSTANCYRLWHLKKLIGAVNETARVQIVAANPTCSIPCYHRCSF